MPLLPKVSKASRDLRLARLLPRRGRDGGANWLRCLVRRVYVR